MASGVAKKKLSLNCSHLNSIRSFLLTFPGKVGLTASYAGLRKKYVTPVKFKLETFLKKMASGVAEKAPFKLLSFEFYSIVSLNIWWKGRPGCRLPSVPKDIRYQQSNSSESLYSKKFFYLEGMVQIDWKHRNSC